MSGKKHLRSHCPINFSLESFGDKWALLIIRDIVFRGKKTYGEFLKSEEGFSTNILASRLEHFLDHGILKKEQGQEDARIEFYSLTEKGLDLIPVLFEMLLWSAKYDAKSEARRIPGLVELIKKNNRKVSHDSQETVRKGQGIVYQYLPGSR